MSSRSRMSTRMTERRALLPALALAVSLGSCAPLPSAPDMSRAHGAARPAQATALAETATEVIAQLAPGVWGDDVATSYGSAVLDTIPELNIQLLRTPDGTTASTFVHRLQLDPRVAFAEPNSQAETAEARQSTIGFSEATRTWSDVQDQNALVRVGAAQAQMIARGDQVLVAILDTGIDLDHPVLAGSLSLPGIEPGVTVSPGDDRPQFLDTNLDGIIDGSLGHGTHVAGIVHAIAPDARLLAVRVLDSDGVGYAFDIARGLVLAVDRGASVANLSLGMPGTSLAVKAAVDFARAAGVVVVAAAGNQNSTQIDFPASYPPVLAVAGTDPNDLKAAFSDYGGAVDVAAPSVGILSTYWDGTYALWSGTSMAAPFASGIAALAYGVEGPRSPTRAAAVEALVSSSAQSLVAIDPTYGSLLGSGRVSAAAAMAGFGARGGIDSPPTPDTGQLSR